MYKYIKTISMLMTMNFSMENKRENPDQLNPNNPYSFFEIILNEIFTQEGDAYLEPFCGILSKVINFAQENPSLNQFISSEKVDENNQTWKYCCSLLEDASCSDPNICREKIEKITDVLPHNQIKKDFLTISPIIIKIITKYMECNINNQ
jgi:hypothetical protein